MCVCHQPRLDPGGEYISRHGRRDRLEDVRGDRLESWRGPHGPLPTPGPVAWPGPYRSAVCASRPSSRSQPCPALHYRPVLWPAPQRQGDRRRQRPAARRGDETMKPRIDGTSFGSITVGGTVFEHDIIIRPDGAVKKRKKKLSKAIYGTSHMISL